MLSIENRAFRALEYGCIRAKKGAPLAFRLNEIFTDAESVLQKYRPEEVVVENAFYAKNVRTTLILGHVRGILLLAGKRCGANVVELSPREIKRFVTGNGAASKTRVQFMATRHLGLKEPPRPIDAADALACALAHGLSVTRG